MIETRLEEIDAAAMRFHKLHPAVWELFRKFTNNRIDKEFTNYSADAVMHRVRWEGGGRYRIDNTYVAVYARWFMEVYPKHKGFFRTRHRNSGHKDPHER